MARSFAEDPYLESRLFRLLELVWPGITGAAAAAGELGASWSEVSTPFVVETEGEIFSHVGLIELTIVDEGSEVGIATVHAVATHPRHRRRGYFRKAMEELLAFAAPRYPALVLTTEHPEYFEPFGFERVQECAFDVPAERIAASRRRSASRDFRALDLEQQEDVHLLRRLLASREPISRRLGVLRESAIFCFNEARRGLFYSSALDCLASAELVDGGLALFDVVAASLPAIEEVVARWPAELRSCTLHFAPDRLCPSATPRPEVFEHDGPSQLMLRGTLGRGRPGPRSGWRRRWSCREPSLRARTRSPRPACPPARSARPA